MSDATAAAIREAADAFLNALDDSQRAKATFDFDNEAERTSWAYFPRDHHGLPLLEMTPAQQKRAHVLIAASLSLYAYAQATAIMALESVLNLLEGRRGDAVRDPGRYFVSIFGTPGTEPWGWRLEGHHICLNFTFVGDEAISPTPIFFGANPAELSFRGTIVTRPCGREEDAGRALLASLDTRQRTDAVICASAPPDFVLMNLPRVPERALPGEAGALAFIQRAFDAMPAGDKQALRFERARPSGLSAARMTAPQRALLSNLIEVYTSRLPDALASAERSKIDAAGIDGIHFAWAGEDAPHTPHYYRLHGPSFLVEYDNTQDDANHVHAVWRDPAADFGADILRAHLRESH